MLSINDLISVGVIMRSEVITYQMIKVCTVYFEGKYSPDYVNKLYRDLKENSIVDFEFICLSDTKHIKADTILPYNRHDDIKKHWHKLKFLVHSLQIKLMMILSLWI